MQLCTLMPSSAMHWRMSRSGEANTDGWQGPGPHRLKASDSGSSNQQHSMLMTLLTGPMHTYRVFSSCAHLNFG